MTDLEDEGRMVRLETLMHIQTREVINIRRLLEGNGRQGLVEDVAVLRSQQRAQKKASALMGAGLGVAIAAVEGVSRFLA
jgi:hypothetical protein